jgi:hypothetical protein
MGGEYIENWNEVDQISMRDCRRPRGVEHLPTCRPLVSP